MSVRILTGDVRERLADLPDASVQCVVTSPPYFGLRDYGTAAWDGGDPACDHAEKNARNDVTPERLAERAAQYQTGQGDGSKVTTIQYRDQCRKCGAVRVDNQIGLEPTLAEYIATLVAVFRDVRRVLRDDGTCWLNLGDSYASGSPCDRRNVIGNGSPDEAMERRSRLHGGLKNKDLMMVPARVAIALQDDGWWLRSDIIWAKKNCMPESVTDRPTSAHEHIFLLTKSARYYYDAEAVREDNASPEQMAHNFRYAKTYNAFDDRASESGQPGNVNNVGIHSRPGQPGRNQRNVWRIDQPIARLRQDLSPEVKQRVLAEMVSRGLL